LNTGQGFNRIAARAKSIFDIPIDQEFDHFMATDVLTALLHRCNAFFVSLRNRKFNFYIRPGVQLALPTGMGLVS
jgi:hypothetical protein